MFLIVLPIGIAYWPLLFPFGVNRLGLGLRGQGSWAGPARVWLGGPRVLGRTGLGLAWGAKGPGPDRLGFGLGGTWVVKGGGGERG